MHRFASPMLSMTLALAATGALAADPVRLTKDEAKQTVEGKTIIYNGPNGFPQRVYFAADGSLTGRATGSGQGTQSAGNWKLEDDGKVCVTITKGAMVSRCYYVMRSDSGLGISPGGDKPGQAVTIE